MNKKYFWPNACLFFLAGLFFSFYFVKIYLNQDLLLFSLFLIAFFLNRVVFLKRKKISKKNKAFPYIIFYLMFFFLGWWRQQISLINNQANISHHLDRDLILQVELISCPELKNNQQRVKAKILAGYEKENITNAYQSKKNNIDNIYQGKEEDINNAEQKKDYNLISPIPLRGKILISTLSSPLFQRGDILELSGKYLAGGLIEDFNYGLYLKRFDIDALSYYPEIKKISSASRDLSFYFFSFLDNIKEKINNKLEAKLSFDSAALVSAMFLGTKSLLSDDLSNAFSRSGLSHIIAISGLHISLLTAILTKVLSALSLSRRYSFSFSLFFLFFYLILIGAPASALRASLMGFFSLLALYSGRSGKVLNAVSLSAFLMLMLNPYLVIIDIGFQLSFLAVLAIIFLHPHIKEYLMLLFSKIKFMRKWGSTEIGETIIDIISISVAVQIFSAPILINSFKQISLIAPLANLLVVSLLTLIISLILLALFFSFLFDALSNIFFYILDLLVSYVCLIGEWTSQIPYASQEVYFWHPSFSLVYYSLLIYFLFKKTSIKIS